ncbi:hypothetical protein F5882DRAFT_308700, partial [Hyaloscypha sp. PMI_1271]
WLNVDIVRKKTVKYSQFHLNSKISAELLRAAGLPMGGSNGGVSIWGKGKADEEQVLHDGEYLRVIAPDEETFLERGESG